MTVYADSSALIKRYVDEPDSDAAVALLSSDPSLTTARHTLVEVRRNLARLLREGPAPQRPRTSRRMRRDWRSSSSMPTCERAATIAEVTGAKTLDAMHLAAAQRAGGQAISFLTFDLRQAQAARTLGFTVLGA